MKKQHKLHGWHLSYFAGKARCYMTYKAIPFIDEEVNLYNLTYKIYKETGARVMPVLETAEGEWLQDTRHIMDRMDARYPVPSIYPEGPVGRFVSALFEAWGDEWWMPIAMHTRWSYPENYPLFEQNAGDALLPFAPRFIKNYVVANAVVKLLRSYCPRVGIIPEQFEMMESWSVDMLAKINAHFESHPYLLGNRPYLGDFGLVGTMYGHLGRDPWPKRNWIDPLPSLRNWIDRMAADDYHTIEKKYPGPILLDGQIPETLNPILHSIFNEFIPMVEGVQNNLLKMIKGHPKGETLPRGIGPVTFPMGQGQFTREGLPFILWKVQGVLDEFYANNLEDQEKIKKFILPFGGERLLQLKFPRLERVALKVRLAQ
jgi:glutathione S-transferase